MGIDFLLSWRSSSIHDASLFSAHRALPGSPYARRGKLDEGPKLQRSLTVAAGGGYQFSTCANNGDGSGARRAPNSSLPLEGICHPHSRYHNQHLYHHYTETSADSCCYSRLGLSFAATASDHKLDVDEHFPYGSSFLHGRNFSPSMNWEESKIDLSNARAAVAGVGVPLSLQMLKRKQQGFGRTALTSGLVEVGNSLLKAFSSMVFMIKEVQIHCLHIQRQFFNQEIEGLLNQVHREMHTSFLWLFQQVFSRTPELMVLLMVLLADFTAFSMASSVTTGVTMSASAPSLGADVSVFALQLSGSGNSIQTCLIRPMSFSPTPIDTAVDDSGWIGNGGKWSHKKYSDAGNGGHQADTSKVFSCVSKQSYSAEDSLPPELSSTGKAVLPIKEGIDGEAELSSNWHILEDNECSSMAAALAYKELNTETDDISGPSSSGFDQNTQSLGSLQSAGLANFSPLDHPAIQNFVAPFTASVEDDSYTCYDRTDLAYQCAISSDASNSMLLANYAQFLFLVRKDHDRAEELFRRAVQCDPLDGNAISRFARFLWLARCNFSAAGKAYEAAVCTDPCNSFHAADYAHFLWNAGQ